MRDIDVSSNADMIDLRDLTDRFEELEAALEDAEASESADEDKEERERIRALLEELCGSGGDHKWRGDWYPGSLISDSYFTEYAEQLADDIGAIKADAGWPLSHIDWEAAAAELKGDYSSVEYDGTTFWYR